ncbi:hypothetical protein [Microbacterium sp. 22296]|uniref:hypothetical protein n=1 Tax=Microbacterium sp. 22296 TaxID=3453903 RepID=UPI003F830289
MSIDEDAELAHLRRRAYSPAADISADPAAMRRLIELEERAVTVEARALEQDSTAREVGGEDAVLPAEDRIPDAAPSSPRFTLPRLRRSTVILLAAAGLVLATLATVVTVVQRVQTDPLQTGAAQIARLSPDPSFRVPSALTQGITGEITAYEEFEGYRVITLPPYQSAENTSRCMTIWQPVLLESAESGGFSYSGDSFLMSICGAGVFPPSSTMFLREDSPERAQTDFPAGTALQFVYDVANDEIVVFRG